MKLPKPVLLVINGLIWSAAGINIIRIGVSTWIVSSFAIATTLGLAALIFLPFHFMFSSIVRKNINRLAHTPQNRLPIWNMMPLKSWLILAFMMSLGIVLKKSGVASDFFIAFFYSGLGSALLEGGIRYIACGVRRSL